MLRLSVALALLLSAGTAAQAATIVDFTGTTNGSLASGTASIILAPDGSSINGTITNTSPFDARITAFGFELAPGNLNGFSGTPDPIVDPGNIDFDFEDDSLGNVPAGFNSVDLDFGYITGNNFSGGSPNQGLDNFHTLSFVVTGPFGDLTEAEIAAGLFVRFQRVGPNEGSDVATVNQTVVPEPASMLLFGTGLAYLARRRLRRAPMA